MRPALHGRASGSLTAVKVSTKPSPRRRWSAAAVFTATALAVLVLAFFVAGVGLHLAGGPERLRAWLSGATPWFVLWRLAIYSVAGSLYVTSWRPRLRAMQRKQTDGGEAARQRLVRVERMLIIAIIAIEATNAPDVIAWISGG